MGKDYLPETKAAVIAAWMNGQTIRQIAAETGVPRGTVGHWIKDSKGLVSPVSDTKKAEIGELLTRLLEAKINSSIALSEHAGNKNWLNNQDASAVAMLLGVSDDKLMRLLEKLSDAGRESESAEN